MIKKTKTILITGCSTGIGYDTAHYFNNKNGYKVFVTARKEEDIKRLLEEGLECYYLDSRETESITKTLNTILYQTGGELFAVFNNAGYGQPGAIEDVPTDVLREQFENNVFGMHELTRQIIPIMRKQGYGRIIQHSSVLGLVPLKFRGAYTASKYAIEGLADSLRLELLNTNIFVSLLNTGPVLSNFRLTANKMWVKNIDIENSIFKEEYKKQLSKPEETTLNKDKRTEESNVVIEAIEDILISKNPKPHYYITKATKILNILKRILPVNTLDKILFNS